MDRLKQAFSGLSNSVQARIASNDGPAEVPSHVASLSARLAWPPKLARPPHVLGEVKDVSNRNIPRDLGRSVELDGHQYYLFGDSFCFNSNGDFVGVTNNTIAIIPDPSKPTTSRYQRLDTKVPEFVPYTNEEKEFCERSENVKENRRLVKWSFGGIIEIPGSNGREGWLFYDTVETVGGSAVKQLGVGVAKAKVVNSSGDIECKCVGDFPLFTADGPLWGNMSNVSAPDGWTYLLSGKGLDNFMARIRTDADFTIKANYQFLKKTGKWQSSYCGPHGPFGELAHDILSGQGQGAIIHVPEFAPVGKDYLWFGYAKFMGSKLYVGAASKPEGPWEIHDLGEMPKATEHAKTRYCIYPHLWGSDLSEGKILVTWSDDGTMGGKVFAGLFQFALDRRYHR